MAETKRIIIGSELDDTKRIELQAAGTLVIFPVGIYGSDGSLFSPKTDSSGFLKVNLAAGGLTLSAGTSTIGNVGSVPTTTGGLSTSSFLSTAVVQATIAKTSAGQFYGIHFFNNSATIAYIRIYNQASLPGTGDAANIVWRGMVPANTSAAGVVIHIPQGVACSNGIGYRVTAAVADNDATALAANVVMGNILYF